MKDLVNRASRMCLWMFSLWQDRRRIPVNAKETEMFCESNKY